VRAVRVGGLPVPGAAEVFDFEPQAGLAQLGTDSEELPGGEAVQDSEVTLIPGLFQTPEYARAMLAARPHVTADEVENLVSARLTRQEILDGEDAPLIYAVIDEAALHRQVGGPKVMRDQLEHLVAMSRRPAITVQVIPFSLGEHIGLQGGLVIAQDGDGAVTVFLDNLADGQVTDNEETVSQVTQRFESLRGEALPKGASRDLIQTIAEERHSP